MSVGHCRASETLESDLTSSHSFPIPHWFFMWLLFLETVATKHQFLRGVTEKNAALSNHSKLKLGTNSSKYFVWYLTNVAVFPKQINRCPAVPLGIHCDISEPLGVHFGNRLKAISVTHGLLTWVFTWNLNRHCLVHSTKDYQNISCEDILQNISCRISLAKIFSVFYGR